jgi:parallel beta-helix repeat protein
MGKGFALVLVILILSVMVLGTAQVLPVRSQYQGSITINVDGTVSPSTAPIRQVDNAYTLTENLTGSIVLKRNNTILDGFGYTLLGQGHDYISGELSLNQVSNVTVQNFNVRYNNAQTIGILLNKTSNVLVTKNTVKGFESFEAMFVGGGSYTGIIVEGGHSNVISGNNVASNNFDIIISGSSNNQIIGNHIDGIGFMGASNNTVYHNDFFSTMPSLDSNSVNIWDNGYPSGGNYWSNYLLAYPNVAEIGNSGIGNQPYRIDPRNTQNIDRYPLMEPFNSTFFELQATPPRILIQSPVSQTYNKSNLSLVFSVNVFSADKAVNWTGYSLDGQQNVTITGNSTFTRLSSGLHNIIVYANDTYGNMATSETIAFSVAKPEPFPVVIIAAVSGAIALIVAAGLLVYFKKHNR